MCETCGCESESTIRISTPGEEHHHSPGVKHHHSHEDREVLVEQDVLVHNNLIAERNRGYFEAKNILALNLVSSPGSGKTALLEATLRRMEIPAFVIEGDQQSMNDANRIKATDTPVVQVNTGNGCHLDAEMVHRALHKLNPVNESIVFIENVGNLVCPALFDLGESQRVVIISTTEGEDKPMKYPNMFATSQLCIINKIDLLPYLDFDIQKVKEYALQINPDLKFIELSATRDLNLDAWLSWLNEHCPVTSTY